jgi:uncharacterized membrane protein
MKISWRSEWPHWLVIAGQFALAAANWSTAPDRIPVHWGLHGADRWGGRVEGLLVLPFIALGIYFLLLFLPRVDPGRANYPSFWSSYSTIRLAVLLVIGGIYVMTLIAMRGHPADVGVWAPLLVGAMFVLIGNVMGKLRPNWFVGVRTPWTLSSKVSWTRTHHVGGWMFIGLGILLMAAALVRAPWAFAAVGVIGGIAVAGLIGYSYVVWRADPDKTPPAGTLPG